MGLKNIHYTDIIEIILVFLMILDFNTVYIYSNFDNFYFIKSLLTVIFIFLNIFESKINKKDLESSIIFCVFFYIFAILFLIVNDLNTTFKIQQYIINFIIYIPSLIILYRTKDIEYIKRLLVKFVEIMFVLSIISLSFYFFSRIFCVVKSTR